jgi:hypothetical protein
LRYRRGAMILEQPLRGMQTPGGSSQVLWWAKALP